MMEKDPEDLHQSTGIRTMPFDSNRHRSKATFRVAEKNAPTTVYVLESHTKGSPSKSMPNRNEPEVFLVENGNKSPPNDDEMIFNGKKRSQPPSTTVFLEPQIVSQPVLYNIAGARQTPRMKATPMTNQQTPIIYSIASRPSEPTPPTATMTDDDAPMAQRANRTMKNYSRMESPPLAQNMPMPSPHFYSITSTAGRTSRGTQVDTITPMEPAPILYTIVGDTPVNRRRDKENRPPATEPNESEINNDLIIYVPTNEVYPSKRSQPTMYTIKAQRDSPPEITVTKAPARRMTTPPATLVTNQRLGRSLDARTEPVAEEIMTYTTPKNSQRTSSNDPTPPKPEAMIIPIHDEKPLIKYPAAPISTNRSTNGFRTQKPHRERNFHQTLPVISNTRQEKRSQIISQNSRYHNERSNPNTANKPTNSLERTKVRTTNQVRRWNDDHLAQTDDDETYDQKLSKINRQARPVRSRAPWIPVW